MWKLSLIPLPERSTKAHFSSIYGRPWPAPVSKFYKAVKASYDSPDPPAVLTILCLFTVKIYYVLDVAYPGQDSNLKIIQETCQIWMSWIPRGKINNYSVTSLEWCCDFYLYPHSWEVRLGVPPSWSGIKQQPNTTEGAWAWNLESWVLLSEWLCLR